MLNFSGEAALVASVRAALAFAGAADPPAKILESRTAPHRISSEEPPCYE